MTDLYDYFLGILVKKLGNARKKDQRNQRLTKEFDIFQECLYNSSMEIEINPLLGNTYID